MSYYVYLLARSTALYLGVTNDIVRRVYEHRTKALRDRAMASTNWSGLKSTMTRSTPSRGKKELKKWRRDWKIRLIEEQNPEWVDLYPGIAS
jgi:putative endonuclease